MTGRLMGGRRGAALLLLLAVAAWSLLVFARLPAGTFPHVGDWDQYLTFLEIQRRALMAYGELPWWNPWLLGGVPGIAHPQFTTFSPFFAPVLLLGTIRGAFVLFALHALAGAAGVYRLGRLVRHGRPAALFGAAAFLAVFAPFVMGGVVNRMNGSLVPWLLFGFLRAREKTSGLMVVAMTTAVLLLDGGFYALLGGGLLVLLFALLDAFERGGKETARSLLRFGAAALLGVALAGIRLLPTIELHLQFPRESGIYGGQPILAFERIAALPAALAALLTASNVGQRELLFGQDLFLGVDLGLPLLGLLLASLFLARPRWKLWVVMGVTLLLVLGKAAPVDLWAALTRLPGLHSFHLPMSLLFVPFVPLALLVGGAAEGLVERVAPAGTADAKPAANRACRALAWTALAVGGFAPIAMDAWRLFDRLPTEAETPELGAEAPFVQTRGLRSTMLPSIRRNEGVVAAYEEVIRSKLVVAAKPREETKGRAESFLERAGGPLAPTRWSPNAIEFTWAGGSIDRVIVNQNALPGWTAEWNGEPIAVSAADGRLAVELPAERGDLVLRYAPRMRLAGGVISGAALLLLALLGWRRR